VKTQLLARLATPLNGQADLHSYAHALRGFDESGEKVPAEAVGINGDSKHYYYRV
jgi:hypothetical protein